MGLERLTNALAYISEATREGDYSPLEAYRTDVPYMELKLNDVAKAFFSQAWVQERMLEMNKDNLHEKQEGVYGVPVGTYTQKNAKRKGLVHYNYYETGKTYDALSVEVREESVDIVLDESAPDYSFELNPHAWGIQGGDIEEFMPDLLEDTQIALKNYFNNIPDE